ncbi:MAG TPA: carboxypeptidase M32, partial [Allocoleopsis sp.]
MQNQLNQLKTHLLEINDLESACNLLHWDQATYMPPGGATARGRQMATLRKIAHDKFTSPIICELLASLQNYAQNLPDNSDDASLIRITQRHYNKAIQVPAEFMAKLAIHQAECYKMWSKYRSENNFKAVLPDLEKTLELSREYANYFKYEQIADPLIEDADYGMKTETVRSLFTELRKKLVPMVEEITAKSEIDNSFLNQYFPEDKQLEFSRKVLDKIGYDWSRGRQDKTLHPFMTKFSLGDVRITTRVYENNLEQCLFCSMHEMGHAFYEMGINPNYEGTPLAHGTSSGVHESQSRLWENLVGRSREFWHYFYPQLQRFFPEQLNNIDEETFYQGINKVKRSLIRTDADEVTYN